MIDDATAVMNGSLHCGEEQIGCVCAGGLRSRGQLVRRAGDQAPRRFGGVMEGPMEARGHGRTQERRQAKQCEAERRRRWQGLR